MQKGKQSVLFDKPIFIETVSSVVGKKESEGPLGELFDVVVEDEMSGKEN